MHADLGRVGSGRGPTVAFRPYLFATVRNVAASRSALECTVPNLVWDGVVATRVTEAEVVAQWDAYAIRRALASLPEAWQKLLRDTLIDDVPPRVLAAQTGTTANAVAAMSARAREALRLAWIRSHITCVGVEGEHSWTLEHADHGIRGTLPSRDADRFNGHLVECAPCAREVEETSLASGAHSMRRPSKPSE